MHIYLSIIVGKPYFSYHAGRLWRAARNIRLTRLTLVNTAEHRPRRRQPPRQRPPAPATGYLGHPAGALAGPARRGPDAAPARPVRARHATNHRDGAPLLNSF
ncbi:hypothetical protein EVAR_27701_1 [Eumeta japonica]|uniref:Uncharacterized protein n=1 Tax=Eumeta variegata TaxID=151549 RepID=A0A4C1WN10_EUMVA|nr:hypothetical protein EVAR_27701_1 [Eumeta japonica]